ncbi:hypothetical protein LSAT2_007766, partial [Lamellibrachia satsuma]
LSSPNYRQVVDTEMAVVAAVIEWDMYNERDGSIELRFTLSHELKNAHTLAHTWIESASKAFNELLGSRFDSDSVDIVT